MTPNGTTRSPQPDWRGFDHRSHGCGWRFRERFGERFGARFGERSGERIGDHAAARFEQRFGGRRGHSTHVPVDIEDTPDSFVLSLFASGLDKQRFQICVQDDVLTIRYQAPPSGEETSRRFTRRESRASDFVREFALNGKVVVDSITASYADGVLTVQLPKTAEAKRPEQTIVVQ